MSETTGHLSLCLDFCNTMNWHGSSNPVETLNDYSDLVKWAVEKVRLDEGTERELLKGNKIRSANYAKILSRAKLLRETIYRTFSAISHGQKPLAEDLASLQKFISRTFLRMELAYHVSAMRNEVLFSWDWSKDARVDPERILFEISRSAVDLVLSDRLQRVRECANEEEGCGYLFIDTSRNRSRKWCSMSDCGNRDKVRNFYKRHKSSLSKN